jgi:DNA-binding CsgD family transcriptional regulator
VFKLYFEEVNRDFYRKLNDLNPELTTNDHRLCALIKLNMNSKEMASVLNVAPNSIKSSRYRLKKKLGLDMEADLEEFIRSL